MIDLEKRFYEHQGVQEAIDTLLDHLTYRRDVEVYVSLIGDLTDLQIVLAKEMKGFQNGVKEGQLPRRYTED